MGKRETRLVVEKDTVYELDMDCLRSKKRRGRCQIANKKERKDDEGGKKG